VVNWATNNLDVDPAFVDANGADSFLGTLDDDLRLWCLSPLINAGKKSAVCGIATDIRGAPRIGGSKPDMGVYEAPPGPADLDGDGTIGVTDFLALLAAWGTNPGHSADFDGDGMVGVMDFLQLLAEWGPCP
jgi:hypothetical protein